MSESYSSGTTPLLANPTRVLEVKILNALNGGAGSGGGAGTGTFSGSGSPQGVVTAGVGATYLDTSTNQFWAKQSGSGNTGWVELIA